MSRFIKHSTDPASSNEMGRRMQLKRFGYPTEPGPKSLPNLDKEWEVLKADFATLQRCSVPDLDALEPNVRPLVLNYIAQRRALDMLLDACDASHLTILRDGAGAQRVEHYAVVRDQYEDAVESFGELRSRIEKVLCEN